MDQRPINAEIVTIGTELLLGEISDTNSVTIARKLAMAGVNLFRMVTVGDNSARIADVIRGSIKRADVVITTGGLGPTIDDPTREAIAMAFSRTSIFHPELWEQIQLRFRQIAFSISENNKRQAYLPEGAIPIPNAVGTAPGFILETGSSCVIALPGVPGEMEYLLDEHVFPYLKQKYQLKGIIKARLLRSIGLGESSIDEKIADLEKLSNPTVGLAAHAGQVDIRISARADDEPAADTMLNSLETEIRNRLGEWIFSTDGESIEMILRKLLKQKNRQLLVYEYGSDGELTSRLTQLQSPSFITKFNPQSIHEVDLLTQIDSHDPLTSPDYILGCSLQRADGHCAHVIIKHGNELMDEIHNFGGPPSAAGERAANLAFYLLWRLLTAEDSSEPEKD